MRSIAVIIEIDQACAATDLGWQECDKDLGIRIFAHLNPPMYEDAQFWRLAEAEHFSGIGVKSHAIGTA